MSATFQCTWVNFKGLYLLGLTSKLAEIGLVGKPQMSAVTWLRFYVIWSSRLKDITQNVQRVQTGTVSAASRKWFPLTYLLNT